MWHIAIKEIEGDEDRWLYRYEHDPGSDVDDPNNWNLVCYSTYFNGRWCDPQSDPEAIAMVAGRFPNLKLETLMTHRPDN